MDKALSNGSCTYWSSTSKNTLEKLSSILCCYKFQNVSFIPCSVMSVKKNYMERKKCLRNFFWSDTPLHNYNLIEDKKITLWNWRTLIFMEKRRIKKDREKIYVAEVRGRRRRLTTKKGGIFKSICIQRFIRVTSYFAANKVDISTIIMVTIKQNSRLKSAQIGTIFGSRKLLFL